MAVAWIIYVILLGYLCAPDVVFQLSPSRNGFFSKMVKTDDQRSFLHSIIFLLLLVLSLFILFLIRTTFVVTTTTIVPAPTAVPRPVFLTSFAYQQPTNTYLPPPPPVPTIAKVSTGSWNWPAVEVVYPGPKPPPASSPLPAFVPPIAPYNKIASPAAGQPASYSPAPSYAPAPSSSGGGSAAKSPAGCESSSCLPLAPAMAPAKAKALAPAKAKAPTWIPALVKIVDRYNSIQVGPKITSTEWVNYFKTSFPNDISEKFVRVEQKADDNTLIDVMRQLTDYKDKKQTQSATKFISGL